MDLDAGRSYEFLKELDEGAYGSVYACVQHPVGRIVAVKQCKHTEDATVRRLLLREIRILRSLPRHPCVVALLDAFRSQSSGRPYLVFEHMERSLHKELDSLDAAGTAFPPEALKLVAWQLALGLDHLHAQKVVHRDIKPANVLLSGSGTATVAKLCDFGFAREVSSSRPEAQERLSSYVVTRWYRAPEILVGDRYGMAADVWSLGCTLAEMACSGVPLFPGGSTLDQLARIMRCFGPLPPGQTLCLHTDKRLAPLRKPPPRSRNLAERLKGIDPHLLDVISACLTLDPLRRPSARSLLCATYFRDVPLLLAGSPLAPSLGPLLEQQVAHSPVTQAQRAASKRALEQPAGADGDGAGAIGGGAAGPAAAGGGGGRSASDTSGGAAAAAKKRPSDVLPHPSTQLAVSSMQTKAASDSLIAGGSAVSGHATAAAAVAATAVLAHKVATEDAVQMAAVTAAGVTAPARQAGVGAHTRISEVKPTSAAAAEDGATNGSAMTGPRPSNSGADGYAAGARPSYPGGVGGLPGARPSYAGGALDPTAPDRWASTISEPPPPGYRYDRTVSIGVDGLSAPTGADARSALQSGVMLGSDLIVIGPGGSCQDLQANGYGSTATAGVAAAAAVAMDAVARRQIPDAGSERLLQPLPSGSQLPPLLPPPPPVPLLQPLDAPPPAPIPMQPMMRPRGGMLGMDAPVVAAVSTDGSSSSKLRQLLLQPFMVSGGSGSAALGLPAPDAGVAPPALQLPAAVVAALDSNGGLAGSGGITSTSSVHSLRAAARSRGLPLLTLAPHEIAAAADEAATATAVAAAAAAAAPATSAAAAAAAAAAAGTSVDGLVAQGAMLADGISDDDEETIEATVAALLAANTPVQDGRPATGATAAAPVAGRTLALKAPAIAPVVRSTPRAASTAAARRASCAAAIGGDAAAQGLAAVGGSAGVLGSAASNAFDGLVTLGSPALVVQPPPPPLNLFVAPSLASPMTAATAASAGSLSGSAVAATAARGAAAVNLSNFASGGEATATPTPPSAVAAAALAAGLALRRPAREQRVAAGGPPRVVRASASMVEFVPPAPWLPPHQQQHQQQYQQQAMLLRQHTAGGAVAHARDGAAAAGGDGAGLGGGTAPGTGTDGGTGAGALGSGAGGSSFGGLSLVRTNINNNLHPGATDASDASNRILRNLLDYSMLPDQQQAQRALQPPGGGVAHSAGSTAAAASARQDSGLLLADILASPSGAPPALPPGAAPIVHNLSLRRPGAAAIAAAAAAAAAAGQKPPPPPLVHLPHVRGAISTTASSVAALVAGTPTFVSVSHMRGGSSTTAMFESATLPGAFNYSSASVAAGTASAAGGGGSAMSQFHGTEPYHETLYEDDDDGGGGDFKAAAPPRLLQAHMDLLQQQQQQQPQYATLPTTQSRTMPPPPGQQQQVPPPHISWDHQRGPTPSSVSSLGGLNSGVAAATAAGINGSAPGPRVSQLLDLGGGGGEAGSCAQQRGLLGLPQPGGGARRALVGVPVALGSLLPGMDVHSGGTAAAAPAADAAAGTAAALARGVSSSSSSGGGESGYVSGAAAAVAALSGGGGLAVCGNSGSGSRMRVGEVVLGAMSSGGSCGPSRGYGRPLGAGMALDVLSEEPTAEQQQQQQEEAVARQQLHSGAAPTTTATATAVSTAYLPGSTSVVAAAPAALFARASSRLGQLSRLSRSVTDASPPAVAATAASTMPSSSMTAARDVVSLGDGSPVAVGCGAAVPHIGSGSNSVAGAPVGPTSGQALSRFATEQQLPSSCASAGYIRLPAASVVAVPGGGGGDEGRQAAADALPGTTATGAAVTPAAAPSSRPLPASVGGIHSAQASVASAVPPVEAAAMATAPGSGSPAGTQQRLTPVVVLPAATIPDDRDRQPTPEQQQQMQRQRRQQEAPIQGASGGVGGLLARLFACGRGSLPLK